MTWVASSSASPWARVAPFWLAFCFGLVQVPINAQSMPSAPPPSESRQNGELSLSSLSSLLVERLKLRVQQSDDSLVSFKKVVEAMNDYEAKWRLSEASLAQLQTDHEATLKSHLDLTRRFEDYQKASEDRAKDDQAAVDQARDQLWVWGGAGLGLGLLTGLVIGLIL